jgi:hypothetical protein
MPNNISVINHNVTCCQVQGIKDLINFEQLLQRKDEFCAAEQDILIQAVKIRGGFKVGADLGSTDQYS